MSQTATLIQQPQLPSSTDVLVVGAGPTGLATALSLIHHGSAERRITIVDSLPRARNDSRAIVIHSHTMEQLDSIGAAVKLQEMGIPSAHYIIQNQARTLLYADFGPLKERTKFPFFHLISQVDIEYVLARMLENKGIQIVRGVKVSGLKELEGDKDGYKFRVTAESGDTVSTKLIVGCDGGRSIIRHLMNIPFGTPKLTSSPIWRALYYIRRIPYLFAVCDVVFDSSTTADISLPRHITVTFPSSGFFFIAPTPSTTGQGKHSSTMPATQGKGLSEDNITLYKIAFYIPEDQEPLVKAAASDPSGKSYLQNILDRNYPFRDKNGKLTSTTPKIQEVVWTTTFRIRHAMAPTLYKAYANGGAIIIAGDAAHIHSPAGGQGMNMGICDGIEAGKAIDEFLRSSSTSSVDDARNILERYSVRRAQIASKTIEMTAKFAWIGTLKNPLARWIRDTVLWTIGRFSSAKIGFAWQLSGLRHNRGD